MKIISENTLPQYARNCCVGFSVASFAGPLIAGFFAAWIEWRILFYIAGLINFVLGVITFIVLVRFEKIGYIVYSEKTAEKEKKRFWDIFKIKKFILYMYIGALVEIVASSVTFWVPVYLAEHLSFSASQSSILYSVISILNVLSPFIGVYLFAKTKENDMLVMKIMFGIAAATFLLMAFVGNKWLNMVLLMLARTASGCSASMLWSVYIPSLKDTGFVSTANGFLDFSGYIAASAANVFFANAVGMIGWTGLIYVWAGLMVSGVAAIIIHSLVKK